MTWLELINRASGKGYRVAFDEEEGCWFITTPKAPRRPAQELGGYRSEQSAWHSAAFLASVE